MLRDYLLFLGLIALVVIDVGITALICWVLFAILGLNGFLVGVIGLFVGYSLAFFIGELYYNLI